MKIRKISRRGQIQFCLDYYIEGRRFRRFFPSREKAQAAQGELREQEKATGQIWISLDAQERQKIISIYSEMREQGVDIRSVWEAFKNRSIAPGVQSRSLGQVIAETLSAKIQAQRRPRYVASLEAYLRTFAKGREAYPIDRITIADLEEWFTGRKEAPATKRSNMGRLGAMFSLAKRRGYISDNPIDRVERITVESKVPIILSVEQAQECLRITRKKMKRFLPYLALALFGGVRPEEIDKLSWRDVDLKAGTVTIDAAASKVRTRRIVHLKPNAIRWLRLKGDLPLPRVTRRRCIRKLRGVLKLERWPQDVLRHSAASYMLADSQDAARVASELGNSPGILLKSYKELVTREDAKTFWSITPN